MCSSEVRSTTQGHLELANYDLNLPGCLTSRALRLSSRALCPRGCSSTSMISPGARLKSSEAPGVALCASVRRRCGRARSGLGGSSNPPSPSAAGRLGHYGQHLAARSPAQPSAGPRGPITPASLRCGTVGTSCLRKSYAGAGARTIAPWRPATHAFGPRLGAEPCKWND